MNFDFTEQQTLLRQSIERFLEKKYSFDNRKKTVSSPEGWSDEIWFDLASDIGVLGVIAPEECGGFGGGAIETMVIMEALGGALVVEPVLENAVVAISLLDHSGGERPDEMIKSVITGVTRIALAWTEPNSDSVPYNIKTTAHLDGKQWVLSGRKILVYGAPSASHLIVSARTSGEQHSTQGVSLFIVENDPALFERHDYKTIDDRLVSDLVFKDLRIDEGQILGAKDTALPALGRAIDCGITALCSDAIGAMTCALKDTVAYAKEREQFGVKIGSFQALQHRMVDMHMELELARSSTLRAVLALEGEAGERMRTVSAAKVTVNKAARLIGEAAIQIHGGMGMTDELAIGHYFKRLIAFENSFGSGDYHMRRYSKITQDAA